VILDCCEVT